MRVDGILLLNKPTGISSNSALQKTKRLLKADKAGHTGCLDPLASGMLPICLGEATKFSRFFIEEDKQYTVEVRLGITTTTGDGEGEIVTSQPVPVFDRAEIEAILERFTGTQTQIPPMYSAVKHNGQPLYKLARRGIEIPRKSRTITIHELVLTHCEHETFMMTVTCSKGTYIRTLVEDIGKVLGCGAYVKMLHRLWVAPFQRHEMISLEQLLDYNDSADIPLLSLQTILSQLLPSITLEPEAAFKLCRGQVIPYEHEKAIGDVMLLDPLGEFIGIGEIATNQLVPKRLLAKTSENKECVSV
ncbi:tRNA pseudouridine(55) synthase TruB [Candidatus Berkiella aquae]|nr:tRNA pseudouridine(55) synthase TruB [Candidatus Berkiella aquae]